MESNLFPFLSPQAVGFFMKKGLRLVAYCKMRMSQMFLLYTLYHGYPLLLNHLRQGELLGGCLNRVALEKDIMNFKRSHPNASEEEVITHVLKHDVSAGLPGSPSWHREQLADLIAMVKEWGMPSLFVTFTADEISDLRWSEIGDLEDLLNKVKPGKTWRDAPIENAALFMHGLISSGRHL